jgi:hypothetical protein
MFELKSADTKRGLAPSVAVGTKVDHVSNKTVTVFGRLDSFGSLAQEQVVAFGEATYQSWTTGPKACYTELSTM